MVNHLLDEGSPTQPLHLLGVGGVGEAQIPDVFPLAWSEVIIMQYWRLHLSTHQFQKTQSVSSLAEADSSSSHKTRYPKLDPNWNKVHKISKIKNVWASHASKYHEVSLQCGLIHIQRAVGYLCTTSAFHPYLWGSSIVLGIYNGTHIMKISEV